ncbi:MAG: Sec-independent protein translocase subunit TatA/TatB [Vulcanimicrobiaceae bacterium]
MFEPLFAFIDAPIMIGLVALAALLFGADKLPKLARSAGQAKKEFMMGQIEADQAAAKARTDLEAQVSAGTTTPTSAPGKDEHGSPTA